ncbi:MAG TPA: DASS family sodium-coupled anion symporter [Acidisphaera sp.]|nr:DASS family sodium-coupled anion symporter [Acidisphaera sp.]
MAELPPAPSTPPAGGVATTTAPAKRPATGTLVRWAVCLAPLLLALLPAPEGLPQHAWYFFALFLAVIVGLIVEPVPSAAVGLVGVAAAATLARYVLYSPAQLAAPHFNVTTAAIGWALSGFSNTTVWLIFAAFIFALGYEKTGLGRRIALMLVAALGGSTLRLGYAVVMADLVLAPFTPSNTARSGGTIYPVIKNLPELYDSRPNDPSSRRIGGYLMWTALATTCVTSSMFLTALAPNPLAAELVRTTVHIDITWTRWFLSFLPCGLILLIATPWLAYKLYPPSVTSSPEVQTWARAELRKQGPLQRREVILIVLVLLALTLWVAGGSLMDATTAAVVVVALLIVTGTITWGDVLGDKPAWNTLVWFGTLVTLAGGLSQTGVVKWIASMEGVLLAGLPVVWALVAIVVAFVLLHYLFASVTAHTIALLPVMLTLGAGVAGMPMEVLAPALCLTIGIMGIMTPYGTGPSPVYANSGFLPGRDMWWLGAIFVLLYLLVFLGVGLPTIYALS